MTDTVTLLQGDLTPELFDKFADDGRVAWDIETSGLDWKAGKIGTCQLHNPSSGTAIVQIADDDQPGLLAELLADSSVVKVFHHAPFDLRWMASHWKVTPASVACTKVASRLLNPAPDSAEHSLKHLLRTYLGIDVDKGQQTSDWLANDLTPEQLAYAAGDVINLLTVTTSWRRSWLTSDYTVSTSSAWSSCPLACCSRSVAGPTCSATRHTPIRPARSRVHLHEPDHGSTEEDAYGHPAICHPRRPSVTALWFVRRVAIRPFQGAG